jgi:hypothetical protein
MASNKSALTTNKLIASIKRRTMTPSASITFSDEDLIEFLNEELNLGLIPSLLKVRDEYLVYKELIPIVYGQANYAIPSRAIGNKLRELSYSDNGTNEFNMTQIDLDNKTSSVYVSQNSPYASQFYVQGSEIILFPENNNLNGFLMMYYYIRPNYLVKEASVATIKTIDRVNGIITLNSLPSTYVTSNTYDFVNSESPNNIVSIEVPITAINNVTKTITLDATNIPNSLKVNDYMAISGESCIPNVPTELHSILAQRVALRVLEALGDTQGLTNAQVKLNEMENSLASLLDSRVEGSTHIVKNRAVQFTLRGRFLRGIF